MKKTVSLSLAGSLTVCFMISGCVWENEEELYPDSGVCDTTMVSFRDDIVPVLSNNCYVCHSNLNGPSFGGGLTFEDHDDVALYSERIIGAINHRDGFQPMPRNAGKLDPCPINLLEAWVNAGAQDN
jgi:hypothetical protein